MKIEFEPIEGFTDDEDDRPFIGINDQRSITGLTALTIYDGIEVASLGIDSDDAQQIVDHLTRVFALEKKA